MLTITCSKPDDAHLITDVLDGYGPAFRVWLDADNTRIVVLGPGQRYNDVSFAMLGHFDTPGVTS